MGEAPREPNEADRYLLWRLPAQIVIDDKVPSLEGWNWKYKEPPRDPIGPSVASEPAPRPWFHTSSLANLEALGWLWRGEVSNDVAFIKYGHEPPTSSILRGFGMQEAGLKAREEIRRSGDPERWKRNAEFWGELAEKIR